MGHFVRAEYDAQRDFSNKALGSLCYAPHTNLFFDMEGRVRACCWNWQHPLGNVRTHTLDEMWAGAQAQLLRRAVEDYSFGSGCEFCAKQTADGWTTRAAMRNFDRWPVAAVA